MSLLNKRDISFAEISHFLARHPDFFVQHPELLRQIKIPHFAGRNVASLLEYQVGHLQKQLQERENDTVTLRGLIEEQRALASQIHGFVLQIMQVQGIDRLYTLLLKGMRKYYAADRLVILVFDRPDIKGRSCHADLRFPEAGSPLKFMFTEIFHRGKPLCNSLQEEHLEALFHNGSAKIRATVLLPMTDETGSSLMVLGSHSDNRYRHGNELDLLQFISQVVNCRLSGILER